MVFSCRGGKGSGKVSLRSPRRAIWAVSREGSANRAGAQATVAARRRSAAFVQLRAAGDQGGAVVVDRDAARRRRARGRASAASRCRRRSSRRRFIRPLFLCSLTRRASCALFPRCIREAEESSEGINMPKISLRGKPSFKRPFCQIVKQRLKISSNTRIQIEVE